jgi:hypothetical protein
MFFYIFFIDIYYTNSQIDWYSILKLVTDIVSIQEVY